MKRTTQRNLGYSGSVQGHLNERKPRVARTSDELALIHGAGVVVAPAKRRHIKGHATRVNTHSLSAIGLDDTRCYHADGTVTVIPRRKPRTRKPRVEAIVQGVTVRIRPRTLRGPITDYIDAADRVGLDPFTVARLYRERADNGYNVITTVTVAEHGAGWATDNRS